MIEIDSLVKNTDGYNLTILDMKQFVKTLQDSEMFDVCSQAFNLAHYGATPKEEKLYISTTYKGFRENAKLLYKSKKVELEIYDATTTPKLICRGLLKLERQIDLKDWLE